MMPLIHTGALRPARGDTGMAGGVAVATGIDAPGAIRGCASAEANAGGDRGGRAEGVRASNCPGGFVIATA
ncbi:hypothetical protein GCM10017690_13400 [Microbacterium terregens]